MNYNKDDILKMARDYMKKIEISNKDTIDSILDKLKKLPEDGVAKITEYLGDLNQAVSSHEEGILGIIKEAWNLHEEKREVLSLEDCISMIKKHINPKLHSSACIFLKNVPSFSSIKPNVLESLNVLTHPSIIMFLSLKFSVCLYKFLTVIFFIISLHNFKTLNII